MMRTLAAVARKEFRDVLREKTLVIAFLVQLFIAGFSTLLLTGLLALNDVESTGATPNVAVGYVGEGEALPYLIDLDMRPYSSSENAWDAFDGGLIGGIVFEEATEVRRITVILPNGELHTSILLAALQDGLTAYEEDLREQRAERLILDLPVLVAPEADASYEFVHASLVPILVLTPVVLAGAIAGDSLAQERRSGTLLVLRSAPASLRTVVVGKLLVPIALVPIQVALWALLLGLNGFPLHVGGLLVLATALAAILAGLGLLVTTLVQDEAVSQTAYAVVVLVVGGAALLMPRDPLNLIALFGAGVPDAIAWWSLAVLAVGAVPLVLGITQFVEKRLRL